MRKVALFAGFASLLLCAFTAVAAPGTTLDCWGFLLEHLNGTTLPASSRVPSPVLGVT